MMADPRTVADELVAVDLQALRTLKT